MDYLLALDQGTSSSRSILFDRHGNIVAMAQQEFPQYYPQSGWVEHEPQEIWQSQLATLQAVIRQSGVSPGRIAAAGITNQRETTLVWHRKTGQALCRAIVWQDRRGEALCRTLREKGLEPFIQERTGLKLDAYFSATKLSWILENVPNARQLAEQGELAFGTVDSWLLWQLSKGRVHATDVSNASRTLLFNIRENRWDPALLDLFGIPANMLPEVLPSSASYGQMDEAIAGYVIPIGGVAGDQQSALFGQACFRAGMAKNTYGTGCFALLHAGEHFRVSGNGLLTTRTARHGEIQEYALEGSVFVGGAVVQWLRDGLGIINQSAQVQSLAESVPDSGGVFFVPAFTGLGAPYWDADARGSITGLTRGTTAAHIARAAVESIAYQSAALLEAMSLDARAGNGVPLQELRVDGGACVNDALMQFQADLLGIPVVRPQIIETTALGAAYLAGLQIGLWSGTDELSSLWREERRFEPNIGRDEAARLMENWNRAVRQTVAI
ncbi:glycerol kinase GlpK [Advenella alkanexedens]|uniref:Glycerol kinase n=3 Tax=Advenella TaxID=290425 RepID=A0ABS6NSK3_9BURK|nr:MULTISPECIES: glycerol kinase GlpK [Advenella]MBV4398171.1 glycerol kinase GlpK [Advenella alkanexedens]MDD3758596.1 glycerol kinase GlpK [Advenella sp.]NLN68707.1 glycerol kinase GlpK [Alcaligenaceae bacterium]WKU20851.1 glycerol kinase GlpK [Advenella alkanexedens]